MKGEAIAPGMQEFMEGGPAACAAAAPPFDKILIANRGEIACRIIKTARRMGIGTVAVYSDVDEGAHHVALADESICIGAGPARSSYLDTTRILEACRQSGAQAVHPGYGFLSESAEFARLIEMAGFTFIGPQHQSIAMMGDKIAAKKMAIAAGVDVIPGCNKAIESDEDGLALAARIGYPLMIKASAGGGGRGLRLATDDAGLVAGLASCRSEARSSFGDDRLFLERFMPRARHLEVQVLADRYGNCIHLWERECSIQRRHQKLIEEAPSPSIDEDVRQRMCQQAVALVRHAGYQSVGTVEFLLAEDGGFYFLEMNTRLQVEHGVTECLTGLDLVEQMIRVAAGEPLRITQGDVTRNGWAMECRINADDPSRGFVPSAGRLVRFQPPMHTCEASLPSPLDGGIRLDSGVREGDEISTHYDALICKLISHGADRQQCVSRMREALDGLVVGGVSCNRSLQAAMLAHPDFQAGRYDTGFVADIFGERFAAGTHPDEEGFLMALAVAAHFRIHQRAAAISGQMPGCDRQASHEYVVVVAADGECRHAPATMDIRGSVMLVEVGGSRFPLELDSPLRAIAVKGRCAGKPFSALVRRDGLSYELSRNGSSLAARVMTPRAAQLQGLMPSRPAARHSKALLSPMPGRLIELAPAAGQRVRAGERLAVIETMKMENVLLASEDAVIEAVEATRGESLCVDQVILRFQ